MENIVGTARDKMDKVLDLLRNDLSTVRTGRATPSLVENISVSVYGGTAKLRVMELATIAASDNQSLVITPFDATIAGEIQKGIEVANVGLSPFLDGQIIRINIPSLSEERRQELIKLMRQKLENAKIMVRQARHDGMEEIKKQKVPEDEQIRLEKEIQKVTDEASGQIDEMGKRKEQELLQM